MRNEIINGAKFQSSFACVCTVQRDGDIPETMGAKLQEGKKFQANLGGVGSKPHLKTNVEAVVECLFPSGT